MSDFLNTINDVTKTVGNITGVANMMGRFPKRQQQRQQNNYEYEPQNSFEDEKYEQPYIPERRVAERRFTEEQIIAKAKKEAQLKASICSTLTDAAKGLISEVLTFRYNPDQLEKYEKILDHIQTEGITIENWLEDNIKETQTNELAEFESNEEQYNKYTKRKKYGKAFREVNLRPFNEALIVELEEYYVERFTREDEEGIYVPTSFGSILGSYFIGIGLASMSNFVVEMLQDIVKHFLKKSNKESSQTNKQDAISTARKERKALRDNGGKGNGENQRGDGVGLYEGGNGRNEHSGIEPLQQQLIRGIPVLEEDSF